MRRAWRPNGGAAPCRLGSSRRPSLRAFKLGGPGGWMARAMSGLSARVAAAKARGPIPRLPGGRQERPIPWTEAHNIHACNTPFTVQARQILSWRSRKRRRQNGGPRACTRRSADLLADSANHAIHGCEAAPLQAAMTCARPSGTMYGENTVASNNIEIYISNPYCL